MSWSYLQTESDEITWHAESEDEEETAKLLAKLRKEAKQSEEAAEKLRQMMQQKICSCGSMKCPAIVTFGLPMPKFTEHIEPIPSQFQRDKKARAMKACE